MCSANEDVVSLALAGAWAGKIRQVHDIRSVVDQGEARNRDPDLPMAESNEIASLGTCLSEYTCVKVCEGGVI